MVLGEPGVNHFLLLGNRKAQMGGIESNGLLDVTHHITHVCHLFGVLIFPVHPCHTHRTRTCMRTDDRTRFTHHNLFFKPRFCKMLAQRFCHFGRGGVNNRHFLNWTRAKHNIGNAFHRVQTGYLRSYVLFLVLAAVGIWILLSFFLGAPAAGGH